MNYRTALTGTLVFAVSAAAMVCCDNKPDGKPVGHMATTLATTLTTLPLPDPILLVASTRAATQPESDKSKPGGDIQKVTLPGGIIIEDVRIGKGAEVGKHSRIFVTYIGWLDDKKIIFDDSRPGGIPRGFYLGKDEVIAGWDEGIVGMKEGGVRLLTIPPEKGYGDKDHDKIPANSILRFRIELDHIEK